MEKENIMVRRIECFCESNGYVYKKESILVENIETTLIQFSIKKLFTKHYSIFIMEENDLNKIESFLKAITNDAKYNREHIMLICATELMLNNDEHCAYIGDNGNNVQIVDCVYYNTISKQYNYYTDINTPKCFKQLITYLVKGDTDID